MIGRSSTSRGNNPFYIILVAYSLIYFWSFSSSKILFPLSSILLFFFFFFFIKMDSFKRRLDFRSVDIVLISALRGP